MMSQRLQAVITHAEDLLFRAFRAGPDHRRDTSRGARAWFLRAHAGRGQPRLGVTLARPLYAALREKPDGVAPGYQLTNAPPAAARGPPARAYAPPAARRDA